MKIETIPVGLIRTNCYIAFDPQTREAFIVDPGDTAARILAFVEKNGLHVSHILLTHSHFDHILALADVQAATGALVCIHQLEAGCVEAPDHAETRSLRMPDLYIKPAKVGIAHLSLSPMSRDRKRPGCRGIRAFTSNLMLRAA